MYHDSYHNTKNYQVIILDVSLSPIHYQYCELLIILIFLIILILAKIPAVCNQVLMCVFLLLNKIV